MGPSGGELEVMNVKLSIPEGALDRDTTITIAISNNKSDRPKLKNDQSFVGPVVHCLPHGLRFNKPVTLLFHYSQVTIDETPCNMNVLCR